MKLRWHYLLPLAMFVAGFLLGRHGDTGGSARSQRAPVREPVGEVSAPVAASSPAASEEERDVPARAAARTNGDEPAAPAAAIPVPPRQRPDRAIYLSPEWRGERFVHWYRSHAATYGFPHREPPELRMFGEVVRKLGRIPRREVLDDLLEVHAAYHKAIKEVEAAQRSGLISQYEAAARLAPARRIYSNGLHRVLAFSDYLFLTREWVDDKNPYREFRHSEPPTTPRPPSGDPHAIPLRSVEEFVAWYRAYRSDLELPERDHDFLNPFFADIVEPLGRAPRPKLMRTLQRHYAAYRTAERGDKAVRELFRGLRPVLDPIDYDRIRWSENWVDRLQDLGLLKGR